MLERHLDHADGASTSVLRGRDHGFGLLRRSIALAILLRVGEVGEAAFVDRDPGLLEPGDQLGRSSSPTGRDCRAGHFLVGKSS
jgi:hypothetical protein